MTVFATEEPALTDLSPELARVKLKLVGVPVSENHALASELCTLILKALAFTRALVAIVKGPEYFLEDGVGEVPSIV